ncbi:cellulose binding domain-containing protein, partial [Micromonospora sp. D75]|uniref:cellulose binding domain-containing protein n=1 Tax=Micromonospora sp. D75 TaxID=2824885 RepID=UPI001B3713D0
RNAGAAPIAGWTVHVPLAGGQRISQAWNADVTQSGTTVTARNASWNGALAPAAQTTFGFLAEGTAPSPALTCAPS